MSLPGPDGGAAAEQLQGPLHAVPAGLADLAKVTSLCNRTVRVWGERPFDATDAEACPTCVERSA